MKKILLLFFLIFIGCNKKHIPSFEINIPKYTKKPPILSDNNKTLTYSKINYFVYLHTKYIKECKINNNCKVLNTISKTLNINPNNILKKNISSNYIYITKNATKKDIERLKTLKIPPVYDKTKKIYLKPIFIDISQEKRVYPYNKLLTPVIGVNRWCCKKLKGLNGLEKLVKNTPLHTSINIQMQKDLEKQTDILKQKYNANEVMAILIDLRNNKIKAIASSNRYDPSNIKNILLTNININRYLFKSNELLKPIKVYMDQTNEHNLSKIFKQFHIFESSSDLPNETIMKINRFLNKNDFTINDVKLNFLQTTKLYASLINGYSQKLSILKNTNYKKEKIPLKTKIPNKVLVYLNFDNKIKKGILIFDKNKNYLKGYFIEGIR